jgi:signal transduction histidine kinase
MNSPFLSCTPPAPAAAPTSAGGFLLRCLSASLAHNVNNALTGVVGYLELSLRHCAPGSELHAHLRASLDCAFKAADAVQRIMTFAARTSTTEAPTALSLRVVAEQAADRLRQEIPGAEVSVAGASAGRVLVVESLVRGSVEQVLRCILETAPPHRAVRLRLDDEDGRCCLFVDADGRDAGLFAAPLIADFIDPVLGLCRELVQTQGGTLDVVSAPGEPSLVRLSFPSLAEPALADEPPAPRRDDPRGAAHNPHWPAPHGLVRQAV